MRGNASEHVCCYSKVQIGTVKNVNTAIWESVCCGHEVVTTDSQNSWCPKHTKNTIFLRKQYCGCIFTCFSSSRNTWFKKIHCTFNFIHWHKYVTAWPDSPIATKTMGFSDLMGSNIKTLKSTTLILSYVSLWCIFEVIIKKTLMF